MHTPQHAEPVFPPLQLPPLRPAAPLAPAQFILMVTEMPFTPSSFEFLLFLISLCCLSVQNISQTVQWNDRALLISEGVCGSLELALSLKHEEKQEEEARLFTSWTGFRSHHPWIFSLSLFCLSISSGLIKKRKEQNNPQIINSTKVVLKQTGWLSEIGTCWLGTGGETSGLWLVFRLPRGTLLWGSPHEECWSQKCTRVWAEPVGLRVENTRV